MRASMLLLVIVGSWACGSDPDPHVVGSCVGWTDNQGQPYTGQCEAACREKPPITTTTCDTVVKLGCPSFTYDDMKGCCIEDSSMTIRFVECAP